MSCRSLHADIKAENSHHLTITDPAVLAAEPQQARHAYNTVGLHEAIGYVTPTTTTKAAATRSAKPDTTGSTPPTKHTAPTTAPINHDPRA